MFSTRSSSINNCGYCPYCCYTLLANFDLSTFKSEPILALIDLYSPEGMIQAKNPGLDCRTNRVLLELILDLSTDLVSKNTYKKKPPY